jgi:hypothetical protein
VCDLETSRICAPYIFIYDISSLRVKHLGSIVYNDSTGEEEIKERIATGNEIKR